MSQIERVFLGWDRSPSHTVAEFLFSQFGNSQFDFSGHLVVVPTQQAARRIRETMARKAHEQDSSILGLETVMPSFLLQNHQTHIPLASPWQITAAWTTVLMSAARQSRLQDLFPGGFDNAPTQEWSLATGQAIQRLREQLCLAGLSISDVTTSHAEAISSEQSRWDDLHRLERGYLSELTRMKVVDPVADRLVTASTPALPPHIHTITLACIPDLSPIAIRALIACTNIHIRLLIAAPETEAMNFDDWGRPRSDIWGTRTLDIPQWEKRVISVSGPDEQAACIPAILARHGVSHLDVALGAPDAALIPYISEALRPHGIELHDPANRPFTRHTLFALVSAFLKTSKSHEISDAATLLRHPDVLQFLEGQHGFSAYNVLCELDDLLDEHRPVYVEAAINILKANASGDTSKRPCLPEVLTLISTFMAGNTTSQALALRNFLTSVFSNRNLAENDDSFLAVASLLDQVLHEVEGSGTENIVVNSVRKESASQTEDEGSRGDSAHAILANLSTLTYPAPSHGDAMTIEGWMELPWNDAPLLIVTTFNEGFIPTHHRHSLFLPDSARAKMGMDCDATTLARDAYLLRLLIESRKTGGDCYFITAHQGTDAEPLKPSRLFFNTDDTQVRMDRAALSFGLASFGPPLVSEPTLPPRTIPFTLSPPLPTSLEPPTHISISALNDYLTCPFHYYLRHVLRMNPVEPIQAEPTPSQFGQLIHLALNQMATDPTLRTTCNADELENGLVELLSNIYRHTFGDDTSLAIQLSHDMAEQRLRNSVPAEIALRLDGWSILHTEHPVEMPLGGLILKGRIDRIDRHEDGRLLLIDYKTGKSKSTPEGQHIKRARPDSPEWLLLRDDTKKRWVNLQLPLYAWLIGQTIRSDALPTLCLFNLGPLHEDSGPKLWDEFNDEQLSAALDTASASISKIRHNVFWPPMSGNHALQSLSALFQDPPDRVIASDIRTTLTGTERTRP